MKRAGRLGVVALLVLGVPGVAQAATITVSTTQDVIAKNGVCSLREAVISANTDSAAASGGDCVAGSGDDTIVLPAGTYRLTLRGNEDSSFSPLDNDATVNDLDVTSDATIEGAGAASTIIDANGIDRAFDGYADLQLEGLTITGGRAQNTGVNRSDDGGGVRAAANLVLADCVFDDNQAAAGMPGASATGAAGGGLALAGVGSSGGDGGAVYAEAGLTVTGTRFEDNVAGAGGASGNAQGGAGTVSSTSMVGVNGGGAGAFAGGVGGDGGAIWAATGAAITGSTFVGNTAGAGGMGGSATGGLGGLFLSLASGAPPPAIGTGGGALSGSGGAGGAGGALYVAAGAGDIAQSSFSTNRSGAGGDAGTATGGTSGLLGLFGGVSSAAGGAGTGGAGGVGGDGGAIATAPGTGTLNLTDSTLAGNATGAGGAGGHGVGGDTGGEAVGGPTGGSIAAGVAQGGGGGDAGDGGGVAVAGGATLLNVTVNGNAAVAGGAGGLATPGFGTPASAAGGLGGFGGIGGGIADVAASSHIDIRNATLSGNTSGEDGAEGAPHGPGGGATLGGGSALGRSDGTISVVASIFSGNEAPGCFSAATQGSIADGGGNVRFPAADASCPGAVGDAGLAPLGDNGGPVATQAPAANGAAIDAAATAGCPATDARGAPRPVGKACDAGAYELTPPSAATGAAQGITRNGATVTATVDSHGPSGSVRFEFGPTTSYGAQVDAQPLGSGFGNRSVTATLGGLAAGTLVHYRVVLTTADGSATGADATFTTLATGTGTAAGAGGKTPPRLTSIHLSATRFAVTAKPTAIHAGTSRTSSGIPLGTTFHLKLSENASVRFSIARKTTTRKGKKKIVRYTSKGAITHSFKAGSETLAFTGWIGRKPLPTGSYRVSISATDAAKNRSKVTTLTFAIVRAGTSTG
jgi:hypothetical protein